MNKESDKVNYERLIRVDNLLDMSTEEKLSYLGQLIDLSFDIHEDFGLDKAIENIESLDKEQFTSKQRAILDYFAANAWSNKYVLNRISSPKDEKKWEFEPIHLQKAVRYLRLAIKEEDFSLLDKGYKCNILTNLANIFDVLGRFIEAVDYWNQAIEIDADFGMAVGNAGMGIANYARYLYDPGYQGVFLRFAREKLLSSIEILSNTPQYSTPVKIFQKYLIRVDKFIGDPNKPTVLNKPYSLGRSNSEKRYRNWCLRNTLFLNPLNDLGSFTVSAQDTLHTPSMVYPLGVGPRYQGLFNQIKQEYVSARYLCFEGIELSTLHFSDRKVLLINTLDYPSYGFSIEKIKIAFRMAYSIFDKIAFFINDYFAIGKNPNKVYFKSIWVDDKNEILEVIKEKKNLPLRGLYWLSKDLFDKNGSQELRESLEPESQDLYNIRNHLEHKFLQIHEMPFPFIDTINDIDVYDDLGYSIKRDDFEQKTIKLLSLVRNSLIYLSLAIHAEEGEREKKHDPNRIILPMPSDTWEDDWKQ